MRSSLWKIGIKYLTRHGRHTTGIRYLLMTERPSVSDVDGNRGRRTFRQSCRFKLYLERNSKSLYYATMGV